MHQQNILHVFIDIKKSFDCEWHKALYTRMKKYSIIHKLIETVQQLYQWVSSVILERVVNWFCTSVSMRQGYLLSPACFNIIMERIMPDALENHINSQHWKHLWTSGLKMTMTTWLKELVNLLRHLKQHPNMAWNLMLWKQNWWERVRNQSGH